MKLVIGSNEETGMLAIRFKDISKEDVERMLDNDIFVFNYNSSKKTYDEVISSKAKEKEKVNYKWSMYLK